MVTRLTGIKAFVSALMTVIARRLRESRLSLPEKLPLEKLLLGFGQFSPYALQAFRWLIRVLTCSFRCIITSGLVALIIVSLQVFQLFNWDVVLDWVVLGAAPWIPSITWPKFGSLCASFFPTIWLFPSSLVILGLCLRKRMWLAILVGTILSSNYWLGQYLEQCSGAPAIYSSGPEKTAFSSLLRSFDFASFRSGFSVFEGGINAEVGKRELFQWSDFANRQSLFLIIFCATLLFQSIGVGRQINALLESSSRNRIDQCLYWALLKLPFVIAIYGLIASVAAWWLSLITSGQWLVWFVSWLSSIWIGSLLFALPYIVWRVERKLRALEVKIDVATGKQSARGIEPASALFLKNNQSLLRIAFPFCVLGVVSGIGMWCGTYFFDRNQLVMLELQAKQFSMQLQQHLDSLEMQAYSASAWNAVHLGKIAPYQIDRFLDGLTRHQTTFDSIEFVTIQPRFQSVRFQSENYPKKGLGYSEIAVSLQWHYVGGASAALTNFDRRDIRQTIQKVYESESSDMFYDSQSRVGNASIKYIMPVVPSSIYTEYRRAGQAASPLSNEVVTAQLDPSLSVVELNYVESAVEGFLVFSLSLEHLILADLLSEYQFLNPQIKIESSHKNKIVYAGQHSNRLSLSPHVFTVRLFNEVWRVSISPPPVYDLLPYKLFWTLFTLIWTLLFGVVLSLVFKEKLQALFEKLRLLHYRRKPMAELPYHAVSSDEAKIQQAISWPKEIERPLQVFLRESAKLLQGENALNRAGAFKEGGDLLGRLNERSNLRIKSNLLALHLAAWQLMTKIRYLKQKNCDKLD